MQGWRCSENVTPTQTRFSVLKNLGLDKLAKPTGRSARGDAFYVRVAAAYLDALQRGSRKPVADAAQALGFDRPYVRDLLHEARRRERLAAATARPRWRRTHRQRPRGPGTGGDVKGHTYKRGPSCTAV